MCLYTIYNHNLRDTYYIMVEGIQGLSHRLVELPTIIFTILLSAVLVVITGSQRPSVKEPPRLEETIPYISNAYKFLTDVSMFMSRVA